MKVPKDQLAAVEDALLSEEVLAYARTHAREIELSRHEWCGRPKALRCFLDLRGRAEEILEPLEGDRTCAPAVRHLLHAMFVRPDVLMVRPDEEGAFGVRWLQELPVPKTVRAGLRAILRAMALVSFDVLALDVGVDGERVDLSVPIAVLKRVASRLRQVVTSGGSAAVGWPPAGRVDDLERGVSAAEEVARQLGAQRSHTLDERLMILTAAGVSPMRLITEYLVEVGYPRKRVAESVLNTRTHRLRSKGFEQPISPTARNRTRRVTGRGDIPLRTAKT